MTDSLNQLLHRYEDGTLDRRGFLQAVTAVAVTAGATPAAAAAPVEARAFHHVEVKSLDFKKTGEFYQSLLGAKVEFRKDRAVVALPDGTHLSVGSAPTQASIDHYAFSVPGFDARNPASVVEKLAGLGVTSSVRGASIFVVDPDGRQFQVVAPDFQP